MWAQIIKTKLKPGTDDDAVARILEQLRATEQPDSGLVRSIAMRDQHDASQLYMMVVFGSEEQAREREQDPRREEGLAAVRALMAEVVDGPPEFTDLVVVEEFTP